MATDDKLPLTPHGFPSFCVYGPSGSGKTPQLGIFARRLFKESGGKVEGETLVGGLRMRVYHRDRGGFDTILPEVELGLIQLVDLKLQEESPWIWTVKSVQGRLPEQPGSKKWGQKPELQDAEGNVIGAWAFEGLTEYGNALMHRVHEDRAAGIQVGGGTVDMNMPAKDDDGEDFSYAGHARGDYMLSQDKMDNLINQSMRLPGYIIWTALDLRGNDVGQARQVIGPDVGVGSKLTPKMPQKFTYTWRTVDMAKKGGRPQHRLYLMTHQDPNISGITGVCNPRYHKDTPDLDKVAYVEPADMAKAYVIVKQAREKAKKAILTELSA